MSSNVQILNVAILVGVGACKDKVTILESMWKKQRLLADIRSGSNTPIICRDTTGPIIGHPLYQNL
jgi:hypothetical protein